MSLAELQFDVHAVGNELALLYCFVEARKRCVHFFRAAQEKLVAFHPHPVCVGAEFASVDAEHHVLGFGVFAIDIVGIARGHQRNAHLPGDFHLAEHRQPLNFDAVVLNLDEVAVAEQLVKPSGDVFGFFPFAARPGYLGL